MNVHGKNHPYKHKFILNIQISFVNPLTTSRLFRCLSFYDNDVEQIDQACDCTIAILAHDIYVTEKHKNSHGLQLACACKFRVDAVIGRRRTLTA